MDDPLEKDLDALFRVRPTDMVTARNELADRLKRAGDKAGAARVRALARPTPSAWALNALSFDEPELLARAHEATTRSRVLHAAAKNAAELRDALSAQRSLENAVVSAAERRLGSLGTSVTPALQRKLRATVQAWLAGHGDARPGRMTQDLEPVGFAAVPEVGTLEVKRAPTLAPEDVRTEDDSQAELSRLRAEVETQRKQAERATRAAEAAKQQARDTSAQLAEAERIVLRLKQREEREQAQATLAAAAEAEQTQVLAEITATLAEAERKGRKGREPRYPSRLASRERPDLRLHTPVQRVTRHRAESSRARRSP